MEWREFPKIRDAQNSIFLRYSQARVTGFSRFFDIFQLSNHEIEKTFFPDFCIFNSIVNFRILFLYTTACYNRSRKNHTLGRRVRPSSSTFLCLVKVKVCAGFVMLCDSFGAEVPFFLPLLLLFVDQFSVLLYAPSSQSESLNYFVHFRLNSIIVYKFHVLVILTIKY